MCVFMYIYIYIYIYIGGPGSSVGIATDYGLEVRDRIPLGTRFSAHPDRPWGAPIFSKMSTGSFSGVKCGRGVLLTTHRLLVPRSSKSSNTSTHPLGHTGPVAGSLYYVYIYIYII